MKISERDESTHKKEEAIVHWLPTSALGGIEMAALTLIQMTPLSQHVVATGDDSGPAAALWRDAGAKVVRIEGWNKLLGIAWTRRWKRFVGEQNIRHLVAWSPTRLPQLLSPLGEECHCIVHLGNVGRLSRRARWQGKMMSLFHKPACRPKLLACSQAVADSIEAEPAFGGLIRTVVPNAARPAFFELRKLRPKLTGAPRVWGMLARLDGLKDHRSLIEAVRLLPPETDFRLELIGDGSLAQELRGQVAAAGLGQRVRFLGPMPQPELAMRNWEAFVFTTTGEEGFGIAVAEAMASGLPCVLSDVAALREVAGGCAYYARQGSPADICSKILEVIRNPGLAREMADKGYQRALSSFSAGEFARRYLKELGVSQ